MSQSMHKRSSSDNQSGLLNKINPRNTLFSVVKPPKELLQKGLVNTSSLKTKHARGSTAFSNQVFKLEGDLFGNKLSSGTGSSSSPFNMSGKGIMQKEKSSSHLENTLNLSNISRPNSTNQFDKKGNGGKYPIKPLYVAGSFKNPFNSNLTSNSSKLSRKTTPVSTRPQTGGTLNKAKSYYPSSTSQHIKDKMNMTNNSKTNQKLLNDSNNSFISSTSRNNSNSKIRTNKSRPISKSPDASTTIQRLTLSLNKKTSVTPPKTSNSKNPFDSSLIKQFQDFKNNKNINPIAYKAYVNNKTKNPKNLFNNINAKFGMQGTKKVISGNLANASHNSFDVSTNNTVLSKIDQQNQNTNKETSNVNNFGNNIPNNNFHNNTNNMAEINKNVQKFNNNNNNTKNINILNNKSNDQNEKNYLYQIPIKYQHNKEEATSIKQQSNVYLREKEEKDIKFREITTSPLLINVNCYFI
jgi:hypothetical protein